MMELTEKEAEDFLEKEKFEIIPRAIIKTKEEILKVKIKFPWAMKISSKKIVHKAKIGGIALNIINKEDALAAFEKLSKIEGFEAIIIQEMMQGEEFILGVKQTPEFGHVIMFGKGGSKVEEEKDVSFRVFPLTKKDGREMIQEIKFYKTIEQKNINKKKIIENLLKISDLIKKYPKITELDINPLIATSENAKVIDARIIIED